MRNEWIKFCDKNNIKDGLLREFLYKNKKEAAIKEIKTGIAKRYKEITILEELSNILGENDDS